MAGFGLGSLPSFWIFSPSHSSIPNTELYHISIEKFSYTLSVSFLSPNLILWIFFPSLFYILLYETGKTIPKYCFSSFHLSYNFLFKTSTFLREENLHDSIKGPISFSSCMEQLLSSPWEQNEQSAPVVVECE